MPGGVSEGEMNFGLSQLNTPHMNVITTHSGYRVNRDKNVPAGVVQTECWESEVAGGSDCGLVTVPER